MRLIGPASAWSLAANLLGFASLLFVGPAAAAVRHLGRDRGGACHGVRLRCSAISSRLRIPARSPTRRTTRPRAFLHHAPSVIAWPSRRRVSRSRRSPGASIPIRVCRRTSATAIGSARSRSDRSGRRQQPAGSRCRRRAAPPRQRRGVRAARDAAASAGKHPDVGSVLSIAPLMAETKRPWYRTFCSRGTRSSSDWKASIRTGGAYLHQQGSPPRAVLSCGCRNSRAIGRALTSSRRSKGSSAPGLHAQTGRRVYPAAGRDLGARRGQRPPRPRRPGRACLRDRAHRHAIDRDALAMAGVWASRRHAVRPRGDWRCRWTSSRRRPRTSHCRWDRRDDPPRLRGTAAARSQRGWSAWRDAIAEMWRPIIVSMLVVVSGFSLFLLSSFPPTQRLGVLVCVGAS